MAKDEVREEIEAAQERISEKPVSDTSAADNEPFSVYTRNQKRCLVLAASIAAFFSPLSANIYLPALNTLAKQLNVTNTLITLTVTTYLVCLMTFYLTVTLYS